MIITYHYDSTFKLFHFEMFYFRNILNVVNDNLIFITCLDTCYINLKQALNFEDKSVTSLPSLVFWDLLFSTALSSG